MDDMYSRGIDPNMADPSKCHSHPDVPPQWPPQPKVQAYVQRVCMLLLLLTPVWGTSSNHRAALEYRGSQHYA